MAKANPKANAKQKALFVHDYCATESMETDAKGTKNALSSPSKPPQPQKKIKPTENMIPSPETDSQSVSNAVILAAVKSLQTMMTEFKEDLQNNTIAIANISKAVDFNANEIQDCKEKNKMLEKEMNILKEEKVQLQNRATELEKKTTELERYKRRWNLRLNGLKEEKDENTRELTVDLLLKINPHWRDRIDFILDSVHRVGINTNRPRQIIMQFTGRIYRDELWRATKRHPICENLNLRFAEDLIKEDREARKAVWPKVEQARKEGLKTMFRGPYAYINGQRVMP